MKLISNEFYNVICYNLLVSCPVSKLKGIDILHFIMAIIDKTKKISKNNEFNSNHKTRNINKWRIQ